MKVVTIINETTSIPYAVIIPDKKINEFNLNKIGNQWITDYIQKNNCKWNPFYFVIDDERNTKKIKRRIKFTVTDETRN